MSILESLATEHRLFDRLLQRLSGALDRTDEDTGRSRLESVLMVLFPALDRHEELEERVFETEAYRTQPGAAELLRGIGLQHDKLEALRKDVLLILANPDRYSWEHLRSLGFLLIVTLREHLHIEERTLWPHFKRAMTGAAGRAADRLAREEVEIMERELEKRGRSIEDFLGRRKT